MKILSLFDGISIAQQAFKELGEVEYYASEIDKNAIQITQKNHPNTIQLGDIKDIDCTGGKLHYGKGKLAETDIYFLCGGSPCQDLSIAKKNREGLDGKRSGLFWEYVRILKELKPRYNVNLKDDKSFPFIKVTNELFPTPSSPINMALARSFCKRMAIKSSTSSLSVSEIGVASSKSAFKLMPKESRMGVLREELTDFLGA